MAEYEKYSVAPGDERILRECFSFMVAKCTDYYSGRAVLGILNTLKDHQIPLRYMYGAMPYESYLQTRHWNTVRDDCLREAGNRCRLCNAGGHGSEVELHCHHRTYENVGFETSSDVICLCSDCHALFHQHKKADGQKGKLLKKEKTQ